MDYKMFYADVADWISECNGMATKYNMSSNEFWEWSMRSSGELSNKYGNNDLVKKQMLMLIEWLKEIHENMRS